MRYQQIHRGIFVDRPNRFIAHVRLCEKGEQMGEEVVCHVKNTGRCRELLVPGAVVFLQFQDRPTRKTKYDLIAVYKGETLVNMDSQAPNQAAAEWIAAGGLFKPGELIQVKREQTFGSSRFDLYLETKGEKIYMEVKGVTLEEDGTARFPDAPTVRGLKHIRELECCVEAGYRAYLLFVIQMKGITVFEPNDRTMPEFGQALYHAREQGVHLLAYDCRITPDSMEIDQPIPIRLEEPKTI